MTDYSSLMFDYAVLDRPIVIHAPDWERYRTTRGVYFDLMAEPPGVVARSQDELLDVAALRRRDEPGGRRAAGRVPRALLRAGGRPRGRARRAPGPARRPRGRRAARGLARMSAGQSGRQLVLVVGVGRSGTSLMAGMLGPAGLPPAPARGQGRRHEPARVRRAALGRRLPPQLMRRRRVTVNDSRPAAWERTYDAGARAPVPRRAARLAARRARATAPTSSSRTRARSGSCRCGPSVAAELGARHRDVTMLRHPAEVIASAKQVLRRLAERREPRRARGST